MTSLPLAPFNPATDLVLERVVDVPPAKVWEAWTTPSQLMQWFVPAPWTAKSVELDLRPGGKFNSIMLSPEGQEFPNLGSIVAFEMGKKLVFTDTLLEGFRPSATPFMTAIVEIIPEGKGTRYRATALHKDEETRKKHEEMGFHHGWSAVLDQMVAFIRAGK